jgi:hypothetical protein
LEGTLQVGLGKQHTNKYILVSISTSPLINTGDLKVYGLNGVPQFPDL